MVFASPNSTLIEVEPVRFPCYKNLAQGVNVTYHRTRSKLSDILTLLSALLAPESYF